MEVNEHELIRIKRTKFVEMYYDTPSKTLYVKTVNKHGIAEDIDIPINKIPQVIRGLFSCYQRFYRLKKK